MAAEPNGGVLLPLLLHDAATRHREGRSPGDVGAPRSRVGNLVINEGRCQPLPPYDHLQLVRLKKEKEPATSPMVVKQEHVEMAADLDTDLKCSRNDYFREEMERHRRALEEIAVRCRGREEGGVIVLDDGDLETLTQTTLVCNDDPGQGCSKDDAHDGDGGADDDDDDDYNAFYQLLGLN
ncbi:putative WRKY transcription factor 35 [Hordeum vulgare]|nr:putative WRKY transcription factor 35 [Hordeum vulgare]